MTTQEQNGSGPRVRRIPEGDNRERLVCPECDFIHYDNPKVVVGAVVSYNGSILLCRRSIEPRSGFWTLPAGFLELHESPLDGAIREVREEACAEIAVDALLAVYSVPRVSLVQIFYRAELVGDAFAAGEETSEVAAFPWEKIPWDDIAFPSVHWALNGYREVEGQTQFAPRGNPEGEFGDY